MEFLDKLETTVGNVESMKYGGVVKKVVGLTIESSGPATELGELCNILIHDKMSSKERVIPAEVVGFRDDNVILMAFSDMSGISPGCPVIGTGAPIRIPVSEDLIGRIVDGIGRPIDGKGKIVSKELYTIFNEPPSPLFRKRIKEPLSVGIRAIDSVLTVGKGQRIGIFSGSGIGKSTLIGMIARNTEAEVNVIAQIGERRREVRDFLERDLKEEGLKRSVVVVSTSDESPLMRIRGAFVATTIAEYFRDKGKDVILMMDSITRFARGQREMGLAIGEPPSTRGFTPSVFTILPKLLERTGTGEKGSITGFYTVLVEADDMNEPIADSVRGILDGHIVLSRALAHMNHYPAIDILESISRLTVDIVDEEQYDAIIKLREVLATYKEAYDLINIGAYVKGSNKKIDYAIEMIDKVNQFLKQGIYEKNSYSESRQKLIELFSPNEKKETVDTKKVKPQVRRYDYLNI